jgi:predicted DNA-binding transcriptional regulator AlpA
MNGARRAPDNGRITSMAKTAKQPTRVLRFSDLVERGIVRNRATLRNWTQNKRIGFPAGRWVGPNSKSWVESEVEAWLEARSTDRESA